MTYEIPQDLIELSDLFRRAVRFENHDAAKELVDLTRRFGCAVTYIYGEYDMDHSVNKQALASIKQELESMGQAARRAGLESLLLPLHKDNPLAGIVQDHLLDKNDFGLTFMFREDDYSQDLDDTGIIREGIPTFLDEGIRGLGAIDDKVKYKWDRDIASGGQYRLDL